MLTPAPQPPPLSVFISYSHRDEDLREELDVHLAHLKRQGKIQAWHDRAIEAGTEWDAEIKHQLETADVILLLISPRFIASDYCYDLEMQRAIQRHDEGTARVIPILLRPCDWQDSPFSKLAILPKDAKPITTWSNRDEAFLNVIQGIRRAVESLQSKKHPGATLDSSDSAIAPPSSPSTIHHPLSTPLSLSTYNPATFTGRDKAIAHLTQTLTSGSRLLIIHGMTGIGKTALAESLAARAHNCTPLPSLPSPSPLPPYPQVVLDRGISSPDFTRGAIAILHAMGDDTAQQLPDDQILPYLLKVLTEKPCWLQLDSLEFLLRQDDNGDYHFTDPTWTDFFCQFLTCPISPTPPISPIILTSQALPVDLVEGCDRLSNLWHDYPLRGLEETHWLDLFRNHGVKIQHSTEEGYLCQIARYFDGHPLILKMIAGDISKPVFGRSVTKYWQNYYSQQTRPKLHQSQEQRARHWVNQTLQTLPPLALQMLQRCSVFRRPVPESFYLQILGTPTPHTPHPTPSSPHPTPSSPHTLLTTLKSRYLVEEKDIQNGEIVLQLHNLIRDAAYAQLKADHPTWEATERKAADLWLTTYQPAPDAENLETVRGYLEAFDHYCELKDWEQAKNILLTPLDSFSKVPIPRQLEFWSLYQEGIQVCQRILKKSTLNADSVCLRMLGNYHLHLGKYPEAIEYYGQSLAISRQIGDRTGEGRALGNLGLAYYRLCNYERAIDYHQKHLTIAREIGDRQGEGNALGNLGNAYDSLGNYERAIDFHQQYLTIAREIGDRQGEAISLGNLGNAQCALENYSEALQLQNQKLAIAREIQSQATEAYALSGLGEVLTKLEQYPEALEALTNSLKICQEIGERSLEAEALKNLAELHQQLGEGAVALEYCQQALALSTQLGIPLQKKCEELQLKIQNEKLTMEDT